jgi:CPA1 family monovalent cation:H+ antiporter
LPNGIDSESTVSLVRIGILTLLFAIAITAAARRAYIPESVALVLAGLAAAAFRPDLRLGITPGLVLAVLIPGLVFEAAYRLKWSVLRAELGLISVLAIPGVAISAAIVAGVLSVTTGLPFELAFVVGAMAAATDPIAVVATFRRLGAPDRLATLVEGESLLNDGTGLVLFALTVRTVGGLVDPASALASFVATILVSGAVGIVGGVVAGRLIALADDRAIEISLSIVVAYGAYLIADAFSLSGIIATVIAAIALRLQLKDEVDRETLEALDTIWEYVAFALTAVVFLVVGLTIRLPELLDAMGPVVWGALAVIVGRALIVYVLVGGISRIRRAAGAAPLIPVAWLHVVFWAGLRGAIAVAAALSLPLEFPQRLLLQEITFGIVLLTLLVQGTTAGLVVRTALRANDVGPKLA